jgi:hypothetical protein
MVNADRSVSTTRLHFRILSVLVVGVLAIALTAGQVCAQAASAERSETIGLHTRDWLLLVSDRQSLQSVEIRGNLSAAKLASASHYPANSFNLTSYVQGHYSIKLTFDYPSEYEVTLLTKASNATTKEVASYYLSSGQLLLTIDLDFKAPAPVALSSHAGTWDDFELWTARFGDAFPLWVKVLYAILGIQFVAVGYKWIRFENDARRDNSSLSRFDRGNLLYLWSDVLYKLLITAFLAIAAVMSGQFILLSLLKFMFLAQVDMLSLWDLFVLGFAAGIAVIAYAFRLSLEKSFDLKPLFQD